MDEIIDPEVVEKLGELFRSVGEAIVKILERVEEAIEKILQWLSLINLNTSLLKA